MTKKVFQKIFNEIPKIKDLKYSSFYENGWMFDFIFNYKNFIIHIGWDAKTYNNEKKGIANIQWKEEEKELTKEQEKNIFLYRKPPKAEIIIETEKMIKLKETVKNLKSYLDKL